MSSPCAEYDDETVQKWVRRLVRSTRDTKRLWLRLAWFSPWVMCAIFATGGLLPLLGAPELVSWIVLLALLAAFMGTILAGLVRSYLEWKNEPDATPAERTYRRRMPVIFASPELSMG